MKPNEAIARYSGQPLTYQLLADILKDYKRPNDKIKALKDEGLIEPVKRGLYVPGKALGAKPENGLLANHLYGPSYLSADTALSHYGLIPERVYSTISMTSKASRDFPTPLGLFSYLHLPLPYYAYGLNSVLLGRNQCAIVASPEKALADKIVTTAGLQIRSAIGGRLYLLEDLRMDESALRDFDTHVMSSWLAHAPKRDSLLMIIKAISSL